MKKDYDEKVVNLVRSGSRLHRYFRGRWWHPVKKEHQQNNCLVVFFFMLFVGALVFAGWINESIFSVDSYPKSILTSRKTRRPEYPLKCNQNQTQCPGNYPTAYNPISRGGSSAPTCPDYFRWIQEDLRPWRETGITREMVEKGRRTAHFRVLIVSGKVYVESYRKSLQTRDTFTLWGILQLVRWYPGRLPDLELLFDCDDRPVVQERDFRGSNAGPPPLFRYCGDDWSLDIVLPDWSFWGWAETNIKPWQMVLKDIKEGNKRTKWKDRVPYAYWRGNPFVSPTRGSLMTCNVSDNNDWNTRLYVQDWVQQSRQGYNETNLEDQCTHRYKIYVEGWAWSVSEKYIIACNSPTLYIKSSFYDFLVRGMLPLKNYWPIDDNEKCKSVKFAVEWGNNHTDKAEEIGEAGSKFIHEDLKMEYVYDYMFHLLNEYAKLLKFNVTIPKGAVEICSETLACPTNGVWRKFMVDSMVTSPTDTSPCTLHPYDPTFLETFLEKKGNLTRQVEMWEKEYWEKHDKKQ